MGFVQTELSPNQERLITLLVPVFKEYYGSTTTTSLTTEEILLALKVNIHGFEENMAATLAQITIQQHKKMDEALAQSDPEPGSSAQAAAAAGDLSGSALLQRVTDRNKVQQFGALMRTRLAGKRFRLLYTWSRDGRSNASFHQHCNNKVRELQYNALLVSECCCLAL
jgi:hypothetical protein